MPENNSFYKNEKNSLNYERDNASSPSVEQLSRLILAVFHNHVTALETYWNAALKPVIKALGPSPFTECGVPTFDEACEKISEPAATLLSALDTFFSELENSWEERGIPNGIWDKLKIKRKELSEYVPIDNKGPHGFISLQTLARSVIDLLNELKPKKVAPKERIKFLLKSAKAIEQITCFYHLLHVEQRLIDLQQEAVDLRDIFLSKGMQATPKPVEFSKIITKAIAILEPMARNRRVELRIKNDFITSKVQVIEKDVCRAITNLLSNAIKYSWVLPGEKWAWVDIRTGIEAKHVFVEFENWGVPIDLEDINSERVFEFMTRGRFSEDRARTGSGIGLWDSRTVASRYGGNLKINSRPTRIPEEENIRESPYITTVRFEILSI